MTLPRDAWGLPLLRGIDARGRADLSMAAIRREVKEGEAIFEAGDTADSLFVVCKGEIALGTRGGAENRRAFSSFGEESILGVRMRRVTRAYAAVRSTVAIVPASVIERVIVRQGGNDWFERERRTLRRSFAMRSIALHGHRSNESYAWLDSTVDIELLPGQTVRLPRGARVFLVDGVLEESAVGNDLRGFRSGDYIAPSPHERVFTARAATWLLSESALPFCPAPATSKFDFAQWNEATSLLLIDSARCVSCGECETACAGAHDDRIVRLRRAGETVHAVVNGRDAQWVVGGSCHHCETPACLPVCPTGAIYRDSSGIVGVHASLCTACGSCERACQWGNITITPAAERQPARAVKCDQCTEKRDGNPSCVSACPTGAMVRIRPAHSVAEMGARPTLGPNRRFFRVASAIAIPTACALLPLGKGASGALAGAIHLLLVAYTARRRINVAGTIMYRAHIALGLAALVLVLKHGAPSSTSHLPFSLWITFWMAAVFGTVGALGYLWAPTRLADLHSKEDRTQADEQADAERFRSLSGHSNAVKNVYLARIQPFERSFVETIRCALNAEGRKSSLRASVARVHSLSREERTSLDRMVTLAVEKKRRSGGRAIHRGLRAVIALHAVASVALVPLMIIHGVLACFGR